MTNSPTRTPDGYKRADSLVQYLQVDDGDSPVDLSDERSTVIVQADSSSGQVDITMPSARRFNGTFTVQHPSAANNVVLSAQAGEKFNNNLATATLNAVGNTTYAPVQNADDSFGWAVVAG